MRPRRNSVAGRPSAKLRPGTGIDLEVPGRREGWRSSRRPTSCFHAASTSVDEMNVAAALGERGAKRSGLQPKVEQSSSPLPEPGKEVFVIDGSGLAAGRTCRWLAAETSNRKPQTANLRGGKGGRCSGLFFHWPLPRRSPGRPCPSTAFPALSFPPVPSLPLHHHHHPLPAFSIPFHNYRRSGFRICQSYLPICVHACAGFSLLLPPCTYPALRLLSAHNSTTSTPPKTPRFTSLQRPRKFRLFLISSIAAPQCPSLPLTAPRICYNCCSITILPGPIQSHQYAAYEQHGRHSSDLQPSRRLRHRLQAQEGNRFC